PDTYVKLKWAETEGAEKYNIYRKKEDGVYTQIDDTTDTHYTDKSVELSYTYTYAVTLVTESGVESKKSNEVVAEIFDDSQSAPDQPEGLSLDNAEEDHVTFSWDASDDTVRYYVYRTRFDQEDYPDYEVDYKKIGETDNPHFTDEYIATQRNYYFVVCSVGEGELFAM